MRPVSGLLLELLILLVRVAGVCLALEAFQALAGRRLSLSRGLFVAVDSITPRFQTTCPAGAVGRCIVARDFQSTSDIVIPCATRFFALTPKRFQYHLYLGATVHAMRYRLTDTNYFPQMNGSSSSSIEPSSQRSQFPKCNTALRFILGSLVWPYDTHPIACSLAVEAPRPNVPLRRSDKSRTLSHLQSSLGARILAYAYSTLFGGYENCNDVVERNSR
jgi:hypothetical protein